MKKGKRIFKIFIASFLLISGLVLLSIYNGSGTLPQKEVDGQVETNFETDNIQRLQLWQKPLFFC